MFITRNRWLSARIGTVHPRKYSDVSTLPTEHVVQLRYATLPSILRIVAVHYWFVAFEPQTKSWHRYEVWQKPNVGATSWGHVHKDLKHPDAGIGGGTYRVSTEWRGKVAQDINKVLVASSEYPKRDTYLVWPSPNSNTYIAWILRESKAAADLHPMGIGKDYLGFFGVRTSTTQTGIQCESPFLGLKVGLLDGLEVHILGLTFGVDILCPAIKTPLGRLGLPK
jgi:hypothetical protein